MPAVNIEQLEKREILLKKLMAEQGESSEPAKRRALGKKLRRAQRKRRRLAIVMARKAVPAKAQPKAAAAASDEAKPAEPAKPAKPAEPAKNQEAEAKKEE